MSAWIQLLTAIVSLVTAVIISDASIKKSRARTKKERKMATNAAPSRTEIETDSPLQSRSFPWVRASLSMFSLLGIIWWMLGPANSAPATRNDVAFIGLMVGLFIVTMLDRPDLI